MDSVNLKKNKNLDYFGQELEVGDVVPKGTISIWKLLWYSLTNKTFLYWFSEAFKYALRHSECYRGTGSTDVIMFELGKNSQKIWKEK